MTSVLFFAEVVIANSFNHPMPIKISQHFDGGAIVVLRADQPQQIELNIRSDSHADFTQWFYFRLQGARGEACNISLMNAGQATYTNGWKDYQAVASYDRETWFRVPTTYDGQVLRISHKPECDSVYYAYFEPYTWERHLGLLGRAGQSSRVAIEDLGNTVDGRDLNLMVIGNPSAAKKVWVIARQHPGETMAEWFVEGMVDALLDEANPIATQVLQNTVFYVVPNMNPDGAARGNLRTNAAGANLNREWMTPSLETSPEVFLVKNKMHVIGCDLFLDVHGDEALPYNFVAGSEMLDGFTAEQAVEQNKFIANFESASPDFQSKYGYHAGKYSADVLKLASKYVGHTFQCLSLTLELPFKDNANLPNAQTGWNGARSARLGAAILQPILKAFE
ncbi:M14-type cytosolic carboxypeptidase [Glaciimonas sp. PCH181]|uniref:M14 family metallopeptidase n=1 Tax=Glaciimonas sp. PCH181 TaxID=2133943 RepID=UPI000D38CC4D|nr:M14-type cytosolic carboxypeptidase [Glaciimonas sp. PCH181]